MPMCGVTRWGGIDPTGLFEIPVKFFVGDPLNTFYDLNNDGGHGDILRIAFAQYQRQDANGGRFSDQLIDWIIRNNYHTDAKGANCYKVTVAFVAGGGQCNPKNHFDNPNDGPMYTDSTMSTLTDSYQDGQHDHWIQESLDQLGANRNSYQNVTFAPSNGVDISRILSAFGQNSHALADFYAHSNWVDDATRGGCVKNTSLLAADENGYVPVGLGNTTLWDETSSPLIYVGTVANPNAFCAGAKGDISCTADKTTHGYWNKDDKDTDGGKQAVDRGLGLKGWRIESYNRFATPGVPRLGNPTGLYGTDWYNPKFATTGGLKLGDPIYVKYDIQNKHELAFNLAVEHTMQEIEKLYDGAAGVVVNGIALQDIFKMDEATMDAKHIVYSGKFSKQ